MVRRHSSTGERRLDLLRWSLLPRFTKDAQTARKPINARVETVATSGMFRDAFASRRCLVPALAFYEWQTTPTGKRPYATRTDDTPMPCWALGGLARPTGEVVRTFAIITANAVSALSHHNRQPVAVEPDVWPLWLGKTEGDNVFTPFR